MPARPTDTKSMVSLATTRGGSVEKGIFLLLSTHRECCKHAPVVGQISNLKQCGVVETGSEREGSYNTISGRRTQKGNKKAVLPVKMRVVISAGTLGKV